MRLTLRTLLAFRDGVLDDTDGKILEKKIRDSSTAQSISQRINEAMQNQRLAPIPTDAREFGFDANMVANYLDDTIAVDMLPEMERKCLENDAILGEVASCHQILSRVLSLPAAIPMSLRDRIHGLPNGDTASPSMAKSAKHVEIDGRSLRIDSSDTPHITNQLTGASKAEPKQSDEQVTYLSHSVPLIDEARPNPPATLRKTAVDIGGAGIELSDGLGRQVPEYLMGSASRSWALRALMAIVLFMALVLVGSMAVGPWDRLQALLDKSPAKPALPVVKSPTKATNAAQGDSAKDTTKPSTSEKDAAGIGGVVEKDITEDQTPPPVPSNTANPSVTVDSAPAINPITATESITIKDKQKTAPESASSIGQLRWLPETKASADSFIFVRQKIDSIDGSDASSWNRLMAGSVIPPRTSIVTPPTCRTEFRMDPGIQWTVCGDSEFSSIGRSPDGRPAIRLVAGRAIVFASPDAKEIELEAVGQRFVIRLNSADASCAIELTHHWMPATDEAIAQNKIQIASQISFLGILGNVSIERLVDGVGNAEKSTTPTASSVELAIGERTTFEDETFSAPALLQEMPWWLRTSIERPVDQMAANDLNRALNAGTDSSVLEALAKLCGNRRSETAALAVRTRMMLGEFDFVFEPEGVLNRKSMHSHWTALVQQIPQSLGEVEKLNRWLESVRRVAPERADRLLSLVLPKSQEQLEGGADKLLVESLASNNTDERVLAIHRLTKLTGKNMGYHPDKASNESLILWRKALMKGEIRIRELPEETPQPNP